EGTLPSHALKTALFLIVGFAKGQKPTAKSRSSLIASTSSDDDQMQRSARDCCRIGTGSELDATGLIELDLVVVERGAGQNANVISAHLFVHYADADRQA